MQLLENLNESQAKAVRHTEGPILVLAGAGSGKTRVLTTRIAYLLEEKGISPFNILAITFTNKAAAEMRERVESMVPEMARDLWVCTFHSTCLRILRRQARFLGYEDNFVIYDDADQQTVIKDCLKEINLDEKKFPARAVSSAISQAKNQLVGPVEYLEQAYDYFSQVVAQVYELYQKKLKRNNALDFDDLLMLTVRLFQQNSSVLQHYQNKFRYILVDEYQDTNHAQYVLVNLLAKTHRNLCVVGDPNQGIYGWRGADIQNILSFERDYPEAMVVKLEQNYRSTQTILDAANQVIQQNPGRKEMHLWTAEGEGEPVVAYHGNSERSEAQFVADRILRIRRTRETAYRDFAVLYRTHAMSRVLEELFLHWGIPYNIVGGLRFYERKEIKDLLSYLRLIVNPSDTVSLARIINVPRRGIGDASVQKLITYSLQNNIPVLEVLARAKEVPGLSSKVKNACLTLADVYSWLNENQHNLTITEIVEETLDKTGYWHDLEKENSVESRTRQENLKEFLSITKEFDRTAQERNLFEFLSGLALVTDADQSDDEDDRVTLMTLHSAKGLEFPVVFLIGMEEGVFPHSRALLEAAELEEERRLCYVGITRAKKNLYLTHTWQRTLYGNTRQNTPSRFLDEIPPNLLTTRDPLDGPVNDAESNKKYDATGFLNKPALGKSAVSVTQYNAGDQVRHRKWGVGTVIGVKGAGETAEIKIQFADQGVKTLLARYAPLEKVE